MALSRSMKNLMHDAAQARKGGGNPTSGGGMSGMVGRALQQGKDFKAKQAGGGMASRISQATQKARGRYNPGPKLQPRGPTRGGRNPTTGGPGMPPRVGSKPRRGMAQIAVPGGRMPRGGVMGGPAGRRGPGVAGTVAGKPRPGAGTFGFAARGGGGTPALQQATSGARSQAQAMRQAAAPRAAAPAGARAAVAGSAAAFAKPQGQSIASRIGGTQGPPARRGGMARALGSGGSRRRMLR